MLLRRQTAFEQTFSVVVDFEPKKVGYEAGLVLWWDMHSFASIGISFTPQGRRSIIVKRPTDAPDRFEVRRMMRLNCEVADLDAQVQIYPVKKGFVKLEIVARKTSYTLRFASSDTSDWKGQIEVKSKHLTKIPLVGQPFLGSMFGLYAFGNREPCLDPAYFKDIVCADN